MKTKTSLTFKFRLIAPALLAAFIAFGPAQARGNTALSFTSYGFNIGNTDTTYGWAFSLSSSVSVTDLGVFDGNFGEFGTGAGDGLAESHIVTIWDSLGNSVATALVPAGNIATLTNGFRYVTLGSAVSLAAGNYVIGAHYTTVSDAIAANANGITTAPGVTYIGGRSVAGNNWAPGDTAPVVFGVPNSYFGPNFQFTTGLNGNAVPESGGTFLLMCGSVAALFALRRRMLPMWERPSSGAP